MHLPTDEGLKLEKSCPYLGSSGPDSKKIRINCSLGRSFLPSSFPHGSPFSVGVMCRVLAGAVGLGCVVGRGWAAPVDRERIPSAYEVKCPPEVAGCSSLGLAWDLGSTTVSGGSWGAFGVAFASSGEEWTEALCREDSDGDGLSNGEELGDPCCVWAAGAELPAEYAASMYAWDVSHPGFAESRSSSDEGWLCDEYDAGDVGYAFPGYFSPEELEGHNYSYTLQIDDYELTSSRTQYVDFIWDVPASHAARCQGAASRCYLVALEATIRARHGCFTCTST